jgi:hypothetical protein
VDRHELAWAAGFFDGEGWAAKKKRGVQARINQSGNAGVPAVLVRFQRIVERGRIGGPIREEGRKDLYFWQVSSRGDVAAVARATWPWLGDVKRAEFVGAIADLSTFGSALPSRSELLAWAGGLYDGEGSASLSAHRSHEGHLSPEVAVTQSGFRVPQVLTRLREVMGCGRIYGPYVQEGATMPIFRWKAMALGDVMQTIYLLSPWIGPVKLEQARRVTSVLFEQGQLPRGNPAWGNRKSHCVNGHEYATARIRPYVPRGGGSPLRENQLCLTCLRDYAREQRRIKKLRRPD